MRALVIMLVLWSSACSGVAPVTDADAADSSSDAGTAPDLTTGIAFTLGTRTEPVVARLPGDEIDAVFGPQGGVHTEHSAVVVGEELEALHLALIWAEVSRDGSVLARAGWEFWDTQWRADGDGYSVELPVLIFDDIPSSGPITVRGELELVDGREALYEEEFMLVVQ